LNTSCLDLELVYGVPSLQGADNARLRAVEVFRNKGHDGTKADIWSYGVILYVLLTGALPFPDDNITAMFKKMSHGDYCRPPWLSTDARRLIPRLLDPNPDTRITVAQLVETPWFRK
jgi:5'-AMP-activated protein kinase, catalytic alpha subunit